MNRLSAASALFLATVVGAPAADTVLSITSRAVVPETTMTLSADDIRGLPHTEISATDPHENKEHRYSGVPVRDLLSKVGAPLGEKLRGKALQLAVLFRSNDGYATVFALAEFDEAFSSRTLLLADAEDGRPLPANAAPLRLIVPGDKRAARWAREVKSIEIVNVGTAP